MNAAKLAANRSNATHSTGPKDTTKTRLNGVIHGLTGKTTVIPGESQDAYDEFSAGLLTELAPKSEIERTLADRIVAAAWRLKRFVRMETAFFTKHIEVHLEENPDADPDAALADLFTNEASSKKMRLFLRYQTATQREYDKAMAEYRQLREAREKAEFEAHMRAAMAAPKSTGGFASYNLPDPFSAARKLQEECEEIEEKAISRRPANRIDG